MSAYNPYVAALKAEQHAALVDRANTSSTSSVDPGYEEPPPSYDDLLQQPSTQQAGSSNDYQMDQISRSSPMPSPSPSSQHTSATVLHRVFRSEPTKAVEEYVLQYEPSMSGPYASSSRSSLQEATQPLRPGSGTPSNLPSAATRDLPALLNPPPPSFQRAPSPRASYAPFEPIHVPAAGHSLEDGFVSSLPPSLTQPHPFSTHDITQEDWRRFLGDVKRAGSLSLKDKIVSNVALTLMGLGTLSGTSPIADTDLHDSCASSRR
ncbi:hypothetical protein BD414DRAFT_500818 [Trametes punicea]|nr:hypothetical protein BD414DRAFT_500818 [Trametes punicea]